MKGVPRWGSNRSCSNLVIMADLCGAEDGTSRDFTIVIFAPCAAADCVSQHL
jgi:hypothetical protein